MSKVRTLGIVFMLLLTVTLAHLTAYAAALPKQTGIVTDPIGLFTPGDAKKIADSMKNRGYEVNVLTARGLTEKAGEQLANDAYDGWKLKPNQLMLVVTVEPNFVHLVYENAALESRVSSSAARNAKGIVERAFVPLAGSGKVAEGVIAVGNYVNDLSSPAPSSGTGSKGMSAKTVAGIAIGILVVLLVLLMVRQLLCMARARKLLGEGKRVLAEAESAISGLIVSDLLKELEMGFMQGETKTRVAALELEALELQKQSQELQERLEQQRVALMTAGKNERGARTVRNDIQAHAERAGQARARLEELQKLSSEARHSVGRVKEKAGEAGLAVETLGKETSYPLSVLKRQLEQAGTTLAEADNLDEFDFVQADALAQKAQGLFDELQAAVELLRTLAKRYPEYIPRLRSREEELRHTVQRERLLLSDADPFRILRRAESELPGLAAFIEAGDAAGAKSCSDAVESGLQEAIDVVAEMIANRDYSADVVRDMEHFLGEAMEFEAKFESEQSKLAERFADVHLGEQSARRTQIKQANEELDRLLAEVRSALDPGVQSYRLARDRSERANRVLSEARNVREQCLGYRESLEDALRTAIDRFGEGKRRFHQAAADFQQLQVRIDSPDKMIADGETAIRVIEGGVHSRTVDLYRLEERLQSFVALADSLSSLVERLAREKAESMRLYSQLHADYTIRFDRYGKTINMTGYTAAYAGLKGEVERLIATGLFEEAARRITEGRGIIAQMEQDYLRHMEEERRRNNTGGGGSSGGGGRSSGSAGWGGGSSGGGKSSGSSKW
ncbi:TPM domain-containing protein [Paenibacillus mesophilus]|uniref:TPM domain-containing protein n=1 Tax=Paenibacillus mesophilus TaxID=2582849 RepID=UPI00110E593C|nr:TPM domain-containing protein [Paenibacillus mesophilus]TMV47627.1 TPM domain-containing protein [Paenibacillus mesophilus]